MRYVCFCQEQYYFPDIIINQYKTNKDIKKERFNNFPWRNSEFNEKLGINYNSSDFPLNLSVLQHLY